MRSLSVCRRSTASVPVHGSPTTLGGRVHRADDVALAEDLAARCAMALDNARLYREAHDARRAAEDASETKCQFLAMMSHELRTPLTGVIAFAELLETGVPRSD